MSTHSYTAKLQRWLTIMAEYSESGDGMHFTSGDIAALYDLLASVEMHQSPGPSSPPTAELVAYRWRVRNGTWHASNEPWSAEDLERAQLEQEPLYRLGATPLPHKEG